MSRRLRGFTVVELLVVIAIIGVLVSILLPAVGAVRDSARRAENLNNLRQIGMAMSSYAEANNDLLPPLVKRSPADPADLNKSVSWAFVILPYLEQDNIYIAWNPEEPVYSPVNRVAMGNPLSVYANPRIRDASANGLIIGGSGARGATLDYAANGGVIVSSGSSDQPVLLPSNPANLDLKYPYTARFDPRFSGPFHPELAVAKAAVRDGLSNTIAAGDRWIGPTVVNGAVGHPINNLCGLAGTSLPTTVRYTNRDDQRKQIFPVGKDDPSVFKFGSPKGQDACFVYLDGHARWIPYDITPEVMQLLSAIADRQPIPADAY